MLEAVLYCLVVVWKQAAVGEAGVPVVAAVEMVPLVDFAVADFVVAVAAATV